MYFLIPTFMDGGEGFFVQRIERFLFVREGIEIEYAHK